MAFRVAAALLFAVALTSAGCSAASSPPRHVTHQPRSSVATDGVGGSVVLTDGVTASFVGATSNYPLRDGKSIPATAGQDVSWLSFDVVNSRDSTLAIPSVPVVPSVRTRDGVPLGIVSEGDRLVHGHGVVAYSPPANFDGSYTAPYLDPGGEMQVVFELDPSSTSKDSRPWTVIYAPLHGKAAVFVVR